MSEITAAYVVSLQAQLAAMTQEREDAHEIAARMERERDEARLEVLQTQGTLEATVRQLQEKHVEAARQFEHDHAHLMALAAQLGEIDAALGLAVKVARRSNRWSGWWKREAKRLWKPRRAFGVRL